MARHLIITTQTHVFDIYAQRMGSEAQRHGDSRRGTSAGVVTEDEGTKKEWENSSGNPDMWLITSRRTKRCCKTNSLTSEYPTKSP